MIVVRLAIALLFMALVVWLIFRLTAVPRPRIPRVRRRASRPDRHEFESRAEQLSRKLKGIKGPDEHRDEILEFLRTRRGVEAYVEPRTVVHPLSVVLVADDGEWRRFELTDDSFLRAVTRELHLPVYDAGRTGYPERMRRYKRGELPPRSEYPTAEPPAEPSADDEPSS